VLWTVKLGLTTVGNQEKLLKYLKKLVFHTTLGQIFKHMATDLNKQLTTMQQKLMRVLKNAMLLPPQQYGQ